MNTITVESRVESNMSLESSFTICPSQSAFSSAPRPKETEADGRAEQNKKSSSLLVQCMRYPRSEEREQCVIPGSLLQNWKMPSREPCPAARAIRASPFEPLVHKRNLPKDGTISPLKMDEYYASTKTQTERTNQESMESLPPIAEIRIPTPSEQAETQAEHPPQMDEDWKTLYFCSQRDLHTAQMQSYRMAEENRLLKRQLIEMQRHLFEYRRNPPTIPAENVVWSIPQSSKKAQKERKDCPVENAQDMSLDMDDNEAARVLPALSS